MIIVIEDDKPSSSMMMIITLAGAITAPAKSALFGQKRARFAGAVIEYFWPKSA